MKYRLCFLVGGLTCSFLLLASAAIAQSKRTSQDELPKNSAGFIIKIVAGSNKIKATKTPDDSNESFDLELLTPYYVIEQTPSHYRITTVAASTRKEAESGQTGWVKSAQVFPWPTREALHFTKLVRVATRTELLAWDDREKITKFMESGDLKSYPASFKEDLASSLKRTTDLRPYPVLEGFSVPFIGGAGEKRVYNVLLPTAIPPEKKRVEIDKNDAGQAMKTLKSVTFGIVFDATASMKPVAENVAKQIADAVAGARELFSEETTKMGFVFFRDKEDDEKIKIIPAMNLREASDKLREIAPQMKGGGDPAEPVLDAVALAADFFDWTAGNEQSGARKIAIVVLNDDAKPLTEGAIDPRVEPGQQAATIRLKLEEMGIQAITVQAGASAGPHLREVLSELGRDRFIEWNGGGVGDRVGVAVRDSIESGAKKAVADATDVMTKMTIEGEKAVIPFMALNDDKLQRLREAGIKYNIEDGKGGVLVAPGFIPQNDDLLDAQIKVEKETVQHLLNLFSALALGSPNASEFRKAIEDSLAGISGEKFERSEKISDIVNKQLGIQFRTPLLNVSIEWLDGMNPEQRASFAKSIQNSAKALGNFSESHMRDFEKQESIWMPVRLLP